jgi:hypothetical protein
VQEERALSQLALRLTTNLLPTPAYGHFLDIEDVYTLFPDGRWSTAVWHRVWQTLPVDVNDVHLHVVDDETPVPAYLKDTLDVTISSSQQSSDILAMIVDGAAKAVWLLSTGEDTNLVPRLMQRLEGHGAYTRLYHVSPPSFCPCTVS